MSKQAECVIIYTDGGCQPNPGAGGWAAVLQYKGRTRELSGGEPHTTNNRMELTAVIEALAALKRSCKVVVHTDSEYVKRGVTEWLPAWKRRGWRRHGGALKNEELWRRLDDLGARHEIEWKWVPGHAGVALNERCDELASAMIAAQRERKQLD
ncbi:MAG: ribonuclease HI [Candidatus Hydrogenedentes bacterium]|nr:ribonuclease HI [Candidatus Hydrogenedentota bacterium]